MFLKYSPGSRDNLLQGQVCAVVYLTIIVIATTVWDNLRLCETLHLLHIRNKVVNCEQSLVFKSVDFFSGLHNRLEFPQHPLVTLVFTLGTGHYLSPGGGGDLGLNKVKFSRSPL